MNRPGPRRHLVVAVAVAALGASCTSSDANVDETERNETGTVIEGGDVGVFRLTVGDCLQLPGGIDDGNTQEIEALTAIPCAESHTGEVVLVEDQFFADLDEFPGEEAAFTSSDQRCIDALDEYTGTDYETSRFDIFSLVPTRLTWDQLDDRELVCIGLTLDDDFTTMVATTGSMRGG